MRSTHLGPRKALLHASFVATWALACTACTPNGSTPAPTPETSTRLDAASTASVDAKSPGASRNDAPASAADAESPAAPAGKDAPSASDGPPASAADTAAAADATLAADAAPGQDGMPPGWASRDIDKSKVAGSTTYKDGTFTLKSSGKEVWHWEDYYHYAYRSIPAGQSEIVARVVSVGDAGTGGERAGIILRWDPDWTRMAGGNTAKSTGPGAMLWVTRKGEVGFGLRTWQKRAPSGADWHGWKPADYWRASGVGLPVWLKIVRNGEQFQPYYSKNGTDWVQPKNGKGQPPMGQEDVQDADVQEMWAGLFASAFDRQDSGKMTTVTIDSVKITP